MTKKQLLEYIDKKAEVEQLEAEIAAFYETCLKPSMLDGMPRSGKLSDSTSMFADKAAQLHTKLLYKKDELTCALEKIEDCIASLEPRERRLIREYYINGLTWEQVCVKIGYEWAQTHRIHGNILKKLKMIRNDTQETVIL